jgi:hypothetical protein
MSLTILLFIGGILFIPRLEHHLIPSFEVARILLSPALIHAPL